MSDLKDKTKEKVDEAADAAKKAALTMPSTKPRILPIRPARKWKKGGRDFKMHDASWKISIQGNGTAKAV